MTSCDVLVGGGGSAGLAAAVSAARAGADTVLVERGGVLGGMGSAALVHTICGLFTIQEGPGIKWANAGFSRYFATRLQRLGGANEPVRMGRLDVMPHDPVAFAALADDVCSETRGLRVWLHAELCAVHGDFEAAEVVCRGYRETVAARAFIDATGDATLTKLGGGAFRQVEAQRLQRPAYIAGLRGFAPDFFTDESRLRLAYAIVAAVNRGLLPRAALGAGFRAGVVRDEAFLTIDLEGTGADGEPWDPESPRMLAAIEIAGRRTALALAGYLRQNIAGCNDCRVTHWPARAGVRESRRACGVYEMQADDVLSGASFDDGVVLATWPVELRERATGPKWRFPEGVSPAQIPLRSLGHCEVGHLWMAGRCLSCSHEAQASIRVMGTCLATGEAAGFAAVASIGVERDWPRLAEFVLKQREKWERDQ